MGGSRERWVEHDAWTAPRARPTSQARRLARPVRVGIAAEQRYLSRREPTALVATLAARGHAVELVDPEEALGRADGGAAELSELDALVARGRSPALLALLRKAERLGVPVLNRPAAIAALQDERTVARKLEAARGATPRTGAVPVERRRDEPAALAQPFVAEPGRDLALLVAAGSVWAVRKSPRHDPASRDAPAERVPLTPEMRSVALRCGAVLGLDLYGLDCVEGEHGLVVIAVDDFPDYAGLAEADERLADLVVGRAFAGAESRSEP